MRPIEIEIEIVLRVETRIVYSVKIIHHVKIRLFFLVEIFKIETFQSRLCHVKIFVETVEIC